MIALIMAGGSGTRFWPKSRGANPKQFLKIAEDKSMIRLTVDRLSPLVKYEDIYIVTAASQVDLVRQHLPFLPEENIIIEPFGMNTAPCIALSTQYLKDRYPANTPMLVLPADHLIKKVEDFQNALSFAAEIADTGVLITFGIVPDYPATGYGYIEEGEKVREGLYQVKRFKEKPDLSTAKAFLKQGGFYWNSGMFCWTLATIEEAFKEHLPLVHSLCQKIGLKWQIEGFAADISGLYRQMSRAPIDTGIMEKAEKRYVIPVDIGWSDVGSWKALAGLSAKDDDLNYSQSPLIAIDATGNYIDSKKTVAIVGLKDICLIETDDAILLCPIEQSERVKDVVESLKSKGLDKLL